MKWYEKVAEAGKKFVKGAIEVTHIVLDGAGLIPAAGAIPDLINAGIYALEGDLKNAALSVAAAVPAIGDAAGACKILKRIDGVVDAIKGLDLLPMIEKLYPILNGLMGKLGKLFNQLDIPEPLRELLMKLMGDSAELALEGGILFSKLSFPDQLKVFNMADNINDMFEKDPKGNGKPPANKTTLWGQEKTVTEKGLQNVKEHLSGDFSSEFNDAMINRLEDAYKSGNKISGADLDFYAHELYESTVMKKGIDYNSAHEAAKSFYNAKEFNFYHPDVIKQFPNEFNSSWFKFWGLERN